MLHAVHSVTTIGTEPIPITIEVHSTSGLPQLLIIGMANKAVQEAKDRIRSALKTLGIRLKAKRTIVNLQPANLPKAGSHLDLAIAVGLLNLFGNCSIATSGIAYLGEVGLTGTINRVEQCLLKVLAAKKLGFSCVIVPSSNLAEVSLVPDIKLFGASHLSDLIASAQGKKNALSSRTTDQQLLSPDTASSEAAWQAIKGQALAKRAAFISLAGRHSMHLSGPPGMGKTLIARLLHALLPPLTLNQAIETAALYSLLANERRSIFYLPPFRAPHSSATVTRMLGSSSSGYPGELALAHHGILFLDELASFHTSVLESLRVPMEQKKLTILIRNHVIEYPADCIVVTAANPCPCGYLGSEVRECKCSLHQKQLFSQKLSGPLLDRLDLSVPVLYDATPPTFPTSSSETVITGPTLSEGVKAVTQAQQSQAKRFATSHLKTNSQLTYETIRQLCTLDAATDVLLKKSVTALKLSHRAIEKTIAVAQTIADLDQAPSIAAQHLAEALQYRFEHRW